MDNTLHIAKAPADTRVVVAMSGGVDSSVTAAPAAPSPSVPRELTLLLGAKNLQREDRIQLLVLLQSPPKA